jgi:hypothetical protein
MAQQQFTRPKIQIEDDDFIPDNDNFEQDDDFIPDSNDVTDEAKFRNWYSQKSKDYNLNPDPSGQFYDYRSAFKEGAEPNESGHWPSKFKQPGHPNEFAGGYSTITGEPNRNQRQETDVNKLVEMGYDPDTAAQLVEKNTYKGPDTYWGGFRNSLTSGEAIKTGGKAALGYLKGATIDIPESIIGAVESVWNLAKDIVPIPGNRILDRIKSIPSGISNMYEGIKDITAESGSHPEEFGRMLGQITGQPLVTAGITKGTPSAIRGTGASVELAGRVMRKYAPISGTIPRLMEPRIARTIERGIGGMIERGGQRMRKFGLNKIPVIQGEVVNPVEEPSFYEVEPKQLGPSIADQVVPEPPIKPRRISAINDVDGKTRKRNVRANRDGTFTDLKTGDLLNDEGNRIVKIDDKDVVPESPESLTDQILGPDVELNRNSKFFNKNSVVEGEFPFKSNPDIMLTKDGSYINLRTGEEIPNPNKPLMARSEKGGIKIGVNVTKATGELTTGYSKPLPAIMVREALQNAIDAVRPIKNKGQINVDISTDGFLVKDNGPGLTREQLETVFSDLHSSGKVNEGAATGGKGIGKATYMLGGEHFEVSTVAMEGGKRVKYTIKGTPEEFAEHVDIQTEIVNETVPLGTTIQTKFKPGQENYDANDMLQKIAKHSRGIESNLIGKFDYSSIHKTKRFTQSSTDKIIGTVNIDGNDVTIAIPKEFEKLQPRSSINVHVLNNGMYQYSDHHWLGSDEVPNMPSDLVVDIKPTAMEGTDKYPFPTQRESVKTHIKEALTNVINDRLVNPEKQGRKQKLTELYNAMHVLNPTENTIRKTVFYDPGARLTPDELTIFQASKVIEVLSRVADGAIDDILKSLGQKEWSERLENVGIVLDPNMNGVHIPNPQTGKSTILLNPFEHIKTSNPVDAALETMTTALHEVAHIGIDIPPSSGKISVGELNDPRIGKYLQTYLEQVANHGGLDMGHGMGFVKRLGLIYEKFGPKKTFQHADQIFALYTDKSGRYSSEIQELLHIYQKSRGRAAVTEDFLSGTGVKSKVTPKREGNVFTSNKPNGTRTSGLKPSKLVDQILKDDIELTRKPRQSFN